jgi:hypothetical protein
LEIGLESAPLFEKEARGDLPTAFINQLKISVVPRFDKGGTDSMRES